MLVSVQNRDCLWLGQTTVQELVTTLLMMAGQLPCRTNLARGHPEQVKICRWCNRPNEYEFHVLQENPYGKQMRMRGHSMAVKAITKDLQSKGWTVQMEKWVRDGRVNYRPDIIAWSGCTIH